MTADTFLAVFAVNEAVRTQLAEVNTPGNVNTCTSE